MNISFVDFLRLTDILMVARRIFFFTFFDDFFFQTFRSSVLNAFMYGKRFTTTYYVSLEVLLSLPNTLSNGCCSCWTGNRKWCNPWEVSIKQSLVYEWVFGASLLPFNTWIKKAKYFVLIHLYFVLFCFGCLYGKSESFFLFSCHTTHHVSSFQSVCISFCFIFFNSW